MATDPVPLTLRDGSEVLVRPVRPSDAAELQAGFERLSHESRYRRFLAPMARLSHAAARYLADVDHHDHEALIAFDVVTRDGVGVARFVRDAEQPSRAEAAVTVADGWQGRGLGTLLLELLEARAREEAIDTFYAVVLAVNSDMLDIFRRMGPTDVIGRHGPTVEIEVHLDDEAPTGALRELMIALRPPT